MNLEGVIKKEKIINLKYYKKLGSFGNALLWLKQTGGIVHNNKEVGYTDKDGKFYKNK